MICRLCQHPSVSQELPDQLATSARCTYGCVLFSWSPPAGLCCMCENLRDDPCSSRSCGMDSSCSALHPKPSLLLRKCSHMLPPPHSLHWILSRWSALVSRNRKICPRPCTTWPRYSGRQGLRLWCRVWAFVHAEVDWLHGAAPIVLLLLSE